MRVRRWQDRPVAPRGHRCAAALCAAAAALAIAAAASPAAADDVPLRRMRFAEKGGQLVVSASFSELIDKRAFERLSTGFPTTVLVRGWVSREGVGVPSGFTVATYRVVYDLWDELYTVTYQGPDGTRTTRVRSKIDVLQLITRLRDVPAADLRAVAIGPHYLFEMTAELNPATEKLLDETRRWLSRPPGRRELDPSSSSLFGAFVAVFVDPQLSGAERVLRYRSQPFYRVPR